MLFAIVVINFHQTCSFPIFQIKSRDFTITMLLEASEQQLAGKRDCRSFVRGAGEGIALPRPKKNDLSQRRNGN